MRVNMKHFEGLENEKTNLTELQMQYLINRGLKLNRIKVKEIGVNLISFLFGLV